MGLFMSQFHLLLVVVAFLAVSCQQQQQITLPQDASGSFGLHLNSYPQQSSASYSPSSSAAYTASGTRNWAAGQYPSASGQTDHYGYPSPEQLAQIPAPPLGQQQQQQSTSTYPSYPYATSASSSSAADWRGNQAADAWRSASQQQLVSHNNNLPYSQAQLNALYGAAAAQQQSKAYQQQQQQLYGSSADIYGQNQQQNYGRTQQQQYADSPYYSGQQSGANTGSMQQQRPAGPLNPQFQSAAGRIVFPGDQRAEHNGHSALWFNSALKVGPEHVLATLASLWLIIHAMLE